MTAPFFIETPEKGLLVGLQLLAETARILAATPAKSASSQAVNGHADFGIPARRASRR